MPAARFSAAPVTEEFFASAPFVVRDTFAIARPAAHVWNDLTADSPLSWCRLITRIDWTSPRPFGVGTTRTARAMAGANVLEERFFVWEDGRRMAFYAERASLPLFRRFAEDYVVEPVSDAACRFTWTIAAEPKMPAPLANPVNKRLLGTLFGDTRRHYGA